MSRTLRGWRRGAAFAALAALVFHALLLLVHNPAAAQSAAKGEATVILCTAFGLKAVPLSDLGLPVSDQEPAQSDALPYCPICLGAQLAAFAVITSCANLVSQVRPAAEAAHPPHFLADARETSLSAHAPRAPPAYS